MARTKDGGFHGSNGSHQEYGFHLANGSHVGVGFITHLGPHEIPGFQRRHGLCTHYGVRFSPCRWLACLLWVSHIAWLASDEWDFTNGTARTAYMDFTVARGSHFDFGLHHCLWLAQTPVDFISDMARTIGHGFHLAFGSQTDIGLHNCFGSHMW
jgi:hypothetical protein